MATFHYALASLVTNAFSLQQKTGLYLHSANNSSLLSSQTKPPNLHTFKFWDIKTRGLILFSRRSEPAKNFCSFYPVLDTDD